MKSTLEQIRCRIALLNIGQGELATEAGVSPATVRTLMERNADPNPTTRTIEALDQATRRIATRRWQVAREYVPTLQEIEI